MLVREPPAANLRSAPNARAAARVLRTSGSRTLALDVSSSAEDRINHDDRNLNSGLSQPERSHSRARDTCCDRLRLLGIRDRLVVELSDSVDQHVACCIQIWIHTRLLLVCSSCVAHLYLVCSSSVHT